MKQPFFFEEASEEIEQSALWYRDRSEQAHAAFLRELDHAVETVLESPQVWPAHVGGTQRYVFPTFPFSLIYFVEQNTVNIVAVAHHKRRPGYWRKRLKEK